MIRSREFEVLIIAEMVSPRSDDKSVRCSTRRSVHRRWSSAPILLLSQHGADEHRSIPERLEEGHLRDRGRQHSGEAATEAKIDAVCELNVPVGLVRRPPPEPETMIETIDRLAGQDSSHDAKWMS